MKVTVEMDLTPKEARELLGLPDLEPLHEEMREKMRAHMEEAARRMEPEELMKAWAPIGQQGLEQLQKFMFGAAGAATGGKGSGSRSEGGGA